MNTTINDKTLLLSRKGMKELKKSIIQLEHDRQKALQSLRDLDRSSIRDTRLDRIERIATIEGIEAELVEKKSALSSAKLIPNKRNRIRVAIDSGNPFSHR